MAHTANTRRFYIDLDGSDAHAVVRRVPVHQAAWSAPEVAPTVDAPVSPATHSSTSPARITPQRVSSMFRSVRKRQSRS